MQTNANISTYGVSPEVESFRFLGIGIGIFAIVTGTIGNLLTIASVLRNNYLRRNSFNMFIVNLSIIDLLTAFVMLPFNVTGYALMRWPFSEEACILQAFFYFSCGYTSVVCLISITLNRFLGIVFPDRYNLFFTSGMVRVWLFLCWLIAPATLLPFLVVSLFNSASNQKLMTGWRPDQFLCTFVSLDQPWKQYMQVLRFLFQFLPIILMTFSYAVMIYFVHKSNCRMDAHHPPAYLVYRERMRKKLSSTTTVLHVRDCPQVDCECKDQIAEHLSDKQLQETERKKPGLTRSMSVISRISNAVFKNDNRTDIPENELKIPVCTQRRHVHEKHLVYISIIICLVFTLLFLPSVVINLIPGNQFFDPRVHMAASNVTWFNSCVNPFVYVFMHKGMRKEYKTLLKLLYDRIKQWFSFTDRSTPCCC